MFSVAGVNPGACLTFRFPVLLVCRAHGTSEITEGEAVRHVRLADAQERNNLGGKAALEMRFLPQQ